MVAAGAKAAGGKLEELVAGAVTVETVEETALAARDAEARERAARVVVVREAAGRAAMVAEMREAAGRAATAVEPRATVVKVATELALLDKVWCMHPVRWRHNWYREEGDKANREDREHPAQETLHVQQPKARGGRKTHVEVNQIQVLENSYPSQKHAWSWLIDLETVFLPYAEHVANKTCVGCRLPMSPNRKELDPAAVFRWFCLSWCVE